jgi:Na+/phosphate symporter
MYRSGKFHKAKEEKHRLAEEKLKKEEADEAFANRKVMSQVSQYLESVATTFVNSNLGLIQEDLKDLKKAKKKASELEKEVIVINSNIIRLINKFEYEETEFANLAIRMTTSLQDISDKLYHSVSQNYKYVNNNHKSLTDDEKSILEQLDTHFTNYNAELVSAISNYNFENYETIKNKYSSVFTNTNDLYKNQLRRIKKQKSTVRRSIIMLNLISDFEIQAELSFKVFEIAKISRSQI